MALGVDIEPHEEGIRIVDITPRGSADSMGLRAGDILVEYGRISGPLVLKEIPASVYKQITNRVSSNTRTITFLRDGERRTVPARIIPTPVVDVHLMLDDAAAPEALAIRRSMFGI